MNGSVPLSSEPPYQEQLEAKIESLRQQLASREAEVAGLNQRLDLLSEASLNITKERDQLREQVSALRRSIDFDQIQAQQETIDQLRKNVTLLRNVLDDKQWKKDGDVHAHNKRVQEALAATEPKEQWK